MNNNENKNNKKTAIIVAIIVAILVIVAIIYFATRSEGTIGNTVITEVPKPTETIGENMVSATPTITVTSTPTPVVSLDDIAVTVAPTVQPTATPKPIATATPTMVPTSTPTATPTMEPTVTPTEVPSVTVVPTKTPIATVAPTSTPTPMPTATATATPIPTTTVEPTATPSPTATPTVAPTATPKPTPIPGDNIGVEFGDKVTLDSGIEMSVLTDYNNAGIYSDDTSIYGWYGDGQDNRDATAQKDKEMDALEDAIGVTASNGTGFYVGNFATEFYWGGVGPTPDLALYRDVDNGCYYLAINYDISTSRRGTEGARDVLRMLLSICSSNPIELEEDIYNLTFGDSNIGLDEWVETADVKVCCESTNPVNGLCVITIVQN